ncbi:endonuclease III [ANME-1 cluster archaeon AG-394-G21]|nr:endonuclease III [ANME-1 cluster archaeon AG-394-G21]NAT10132.1 endonuclease III [ANME-1 cluster archaeon AG-394-G06]
MEEKQKVVNKILEYGRTLKVTKFEPTLNPEVNKLLVDDPNAFLFGVIFDQSITAEQAWEKPFILKQRLGHLDVKKISEMKDDELKVIFNEAPKLHRFPNKYAAYIKDACKMLIDRYEGNAANIWNGNPGYADLQRRFELFKGIGQKKASMATNILIRVLRKGVGDKSESNISFDIHVKRVFLRTGLAKTDDKNTILQSARELNPEDPGELDFPIWDIGMEKGWCRPTDPKCDECPIKDVCPKIINERK